MLTRSRGRLLTALIVTALIALGLPSPAQAGTTCAKVDRTTGVCLITVTPPPSSSGGGSSGGGGGGGGSSPTACVSTTWAPTGPVACTGTSPRMGVPVWWSNARQCYVGLADASFQTNPIFWDGRTPGSGGAIYFCEPPVLAIGGMIVLYFWSAAPPAGPAAPPDPRQLALQAIDSMQLRAGVIGIVPEDQPGRIGIVGLPTWMWVSDPGPSTVGPITRTASSAGYTVTATAKLSRIVWTMGDGKVITCTGPGTSYQDSYGRASSPTCGHTYTKDGRYTVQATSHWVVNWSGIGQTGTIPLNFSRSTNITIGESQVIITR